MDKQTYLLRKTLIISIILLLIYMSIPQLVAVGVVKESFIPISKAIKTNCNYDHIDDDSPKRYFVIGIGVYARGGTKPYHDEICPIFLIRFGKTDRHILGHKCGECIDFIEGDKFIGYYPFLNPMGIGFVCGLWIDVER